MIKRAFKSYVVYKNRGKIYLYNFQWRYKSHFIIDYWNQVSIKEIFKSQAFLKKRWIKKFCRGNSSCLLLSLMNYKMKLNTGVYGLDIKKNRGVHTIVYEL